MTWEFPPYDCDKRPIECGSWIQFIVTVPKLELQIMQVTQITQDEKGWILTGLTPFGLPCTIQGVQHVKVVDLPDLHMEEGIDATRPVPDDRPDSSENGD